MRPTATEPALLFTTPVTHASGHRTFLVGLLTDQTLVLAGARSWQAREPRPAGTGCPGPACFSGTRPVPVSGMDSAGA